MSEWLFTCFQNNSMKANSEKINPLARISSYMTFQQRKLTLNSFVISQFSYYSILWMFHSRRFKNRINDIHERAIRNIYQDYSVSFTDLLAKVEQSPADYKALRNVTR